MATIKQPLGSEEIPIRIVNQMVFIRGETPVVSEDDKQTFETNYNYIKDTLVVSLKGFSE